MWNSTEKECEDKIADLKNQLEILRGELLAAKIAGKTHAGKKAVITIENISSSGVDISNEVTGRHIISPSEFIGLYDTKGFEFRVENPQRLEALHEVVSRLIVNVRTGKFIQGSSQ